MQHNEALQQLIGTSVEVLHHGGNIRTCMFGLLEYDPQGSWYTVRPKTDSGSSIRFSAENVSKFTPSKFHTLIYIS